MLRVNQENFSKAMENMVKIKERNLNYCAIKKKAKYLINMPLLKRHPINYRNTFMKFNLIFNDLNPTIVLDSRV